MAEKSSRQSFSSMPRRQKNAVFALSLSALVIIGVWIWQFNTRLTTPFQPSKEEVEIAKKAEQEREAAALAERNKDTDKDGLTDYDEVNMYGTSPYLEDTDGDGISDFNEVRQGKDPLCAEGSSCGLIATNPESVTPNATSTPASKVDEELLVLALSGQGDADTMRQILIQGGAAADQVALLTDEDLMKMYQDILAAQHPEVLTDNPTNP